MCKRKRVFSFALAAVLLLAACVPIEDHDLRDSNDGNGGLTATATASAVNQGESLESGESRSESGSITADGDETTLDGVVALEFHTYDADWIRYRNADVDGAASLAHTDVSRYPFRYVQHETAITLTDLEALGALSALIGSYGLAQPPGEISGLCDTQRLAGLSTDIFCEPGAAAMPAGHVLLALYHPEGNALVAVTTTIDNRGRAAAQDHDLRDSNDGNGGLTATATASAVNQGESLESGESRSATGEAAGCGPFAPGQWVSPAAYAAAEGPLAVNMAGVHGRPVRVYECVVPAGGAAYLQAYGDFSGDGQSATSTGGPGGPVGPIDPNTGLPCTHPLGCDSGSGDQ